MTTPRKKQGPNEPCPCHSGKKYKRCCGPYHGGTKAKTPEALMRSRYAAYALGLVDYVIDTTAPAGPRAQADRVAWAADVRDFASGTQFVGLEVQGSGSEGGAGWVRFHAILTQDGRDASFEERSTFVRRDGAWLYAAAGK